jgi:hypothetical protein
LAYIEWYTLFGTIDMATGMHVVKPSTRSHCVNAEVIEVSRIVRNCHIIPKFGKKKDSLWTSANVGEQCRTFFASPYSDTHIFCLFKLDVFVRVVT